MSPSTQDLIDAVRGSEDSVAVGAGNDSTTYSPPLRRLYVGATGDVKVDTPSHTAITYKSVPTGSYIYCRATRVYASGTTASQIVGEY